SRSSPLRISDSSVPLPAPDGPVNTYSVPLRILGSPFFCAALKAGGYGFRLQRTEHDVIAVRNQHGAGTAAVSAVNQHTAVARFLHDTLNRRGLRTDDCNQPSGCNHIAKTDINQLHSKSSPFAVKRLFD